MSEKQRFCPPWRWWIRTGERAVLGIGLGRLMDPGSVAGSANKAGLEAVRTGIGEGRSVVDSMRSSGMVLPAEAWCLLETSEHTGRLGEGMRETADILKGRQDRKREIIGQLWYPCLILVVGTVVMGLILLWVIPQMRDVSESMGLEGSLPWLTEHIGFLYGALLVAISGFSIVLVVGISLLRYLSGRHHGWGAFSEKLLGMVPAVGRARFQLREAGLLRQLSILIHSGVTLPAALEMAANSVSSKWVQAELLDYRSRLLMGSSFRDALSACRLVGKDDVFLLLAGQESGKLDLYMEQVASDLDRQVSWTVANATRLLEPAMLLGLSFGVGGLVLAYLLPMVRLLEQAGGAF